MAASVPSFVTELAGWLAVDRRPVGDVAAAVGGQGELAAGHAGFGAAGLTLDTAGTVHGAPTRHGQQALNHGDCIAALDELPEPVGVCRTGAGAESGESRRGVTRAPPRPSERLAHLAEHPDESIGEAAGAS